MHSRPHDSWSENCCLPLRATAEPVKNASSAIAFKHKLIHHAAPGIRIWLVFSSGDSHPYSRAGRSEFASIHLFQHSVWLCASRVKLQWKLRLQTAVLLLNIHTSVLQCLRDWHPSWEGGDKDCRQSLEMSTAACRGNVLEAVTAWKICLSFHSVGATALRWVHFLWLCFKRMFCKISADIMCIESGILKQKTKTNFAFVFSGWKLWFTWEIRPEILELMTKLSKVIAASFKSRVWSYSHGSQYSRNVVVIYSALWRSKL